MKILTTTLVLLSFLITPIQTDAKKAEKPPERGILHNNKGVTALANGDIDRAIFEFKTATELTPKYVEAWSNLGVAYKYKGRLDDAISALKTAISLDRKYAAPYNHLGAVYFDQGKFNEALGELKKAKRYNKQLSDAWYNAGLIYIAQYKSGGDQKHLLSAVSELQKATEINPEHPHAHKELARVYQEQKDYEKAIIRFKLALEIDPSLKEGWVALANLYTVTGQTLKAQEALNKSLELDPASSAAHLHLGMNYLKDGNFKMALKEFNQAIHLEPTNEEAYFKIGYTYYKIATEDDGAKRGPALAQSNAAYESAFRLNPSYTEAAFNLAYNHELLEDWQNAIHWYQKAIESDRSFSRSYFALGGVYRKQGNSGEAAKSFCTFVKQNPAGMAREVDIAKSAIKSLGGCH